MHATYPKALPEFARDNVWAKINPDTCEECKKKPCKCPIDHEYKQIDHLFIGDERAPYEIDSSDCDVVTSLTNPDGVEPVFDSYDQHMPVIDLDHPCALVPSSTKGHFHLYLDKLMSANDLMKLLKVMSEVGLVEEGYYKASLERGYTSVRLPWVSKAKVG